MLKLEEKIWNKLKYIIKGIVVILIFWYSSYFRLIPIKLLNLDYNNLTNPAKVALSLFSTILCLAIFFLMYRKDLKRDFKVFIKNKDDNIDICIRYWVIALVAMMAINFFLNFVLKAGGANNEHAVQKMIKAFPLFMFIDAGILAPIVEEIVFRKTLKDIFSNKWLFVISSFLLFGGAHVISSATQFTDYLYIIPYGLLGASFALAYYKTNTLFSSIFMHMMHNTILVALSIITSIL